MLNHICRQELDSMGLDSSTAERQSIHSHWLNVLESTQSMMIIVKTCLFSSCLCYMFISFISITAIFILKRREHSLLTITIFNLMYICLMCVVLLLRSILTKHHAQSFNAIIKLTKVAMKFG